MRMNNNKMRIKNNIDKMIVFFYRINNLMTTNIIEMNNPININMNNMMNFFEELKEPMKNNLNDLKNNMMNDLKNNMM